MRTIILSIVGGAIVGWILRRVSKGNGRGIVTDIILGVVGGLIGWCSVRRIAGGSLTQSVVIAIIGAVMLILANRLVQKKV